MEMLLWRLKISVLWIVFAVSLSTSMVLFMMSPVVLKDIIAGVPIEGGPDVAALSFLTAAVCVVPLAMAFLTLTLKPVANRWANIVLGLLLGIFNLVDVPLGVINGQDEFTGETVMMIAMMVSALLVAWYAWKWPKQSAAT